jgi:hypothetical protein
MTVDCRNSAQLKQVFGTLDPLSYHADTHLYDYNEGGGGTPTIFTREITVNVPNGPASSYEVTVNAIVSWSGLGGIQQSVNLEDHFYDWY